MIIIILLKWVALKLCRRRFVGGFYSLNYQQKYRKEEPTLQWFILTTQILIIVPHYYFSYIERVLSFK